MIKSSVMHGCGEDEFKAAETMSDVRSLPSTDEGPTDPIGAKTPAMQNLIAVNGSHWMNSCVWHLAVLDLENTGLLGGCNKFSSLLRYIC